MNPDTPIRRKEHPMTTSRFLTSPVSRRGFLAAAGVLALGLAGCGSQATNNSGQAAASAAASAGASKVVRIGAPSGDGSLIELGAIAQKEKLFEQELQKVGYDIEYTGFAQAGPAINEAFSSGAIDATVYGDIPALTACANKVGTKAIANANSKFSQGISVDPQANINSIADLKGKRVVVGQGTPLYQYFLLALKGAGLTINDVQLINSVADGPSMISTHQADAFVSMTTALYGYEAQGVGKVLATSDKDTTSTDMIFVAREQFLKDNPDAAKALVNALRLAFDFAKKNPDKALQDLVMNNITIDIIKKTYTDTTFSYFDPELNDAVKANLTSTAQFMKDNQLAKGDIDLSGFLDSTYLDATRA